jgi:pectinesterase
MTAPNTAAATAYGLVFLNCKLKADSGITAGSISLGRPWGQDVSCHFLYCSLGTHCGGWTDMGSNIWQKARFGEYKNTPVPGLVQVRIVPNLQIQKPLTIQLPTF